MRPAWVVGLVAMSGCLPTVTCPEGKRCVALEAYCPALAKELDCGQPKRCGALAPEAACPAPTPCSPPLLDAVAKGEVRFDALEAGACLTAHEAACGPVACARVFSPSTDGGVCHVSEACSAGAFCDTAGNCPGRCVARRSAGVTVARATWCLTGAANALRAGGLRCQVPAAEGASCAPAADELTPRPCAVGLTCTTAALGAVCARPSAAGADCAATGLCEVGHECVAGRCAPLAKSSEACREALASAAAPRCVTGLACEGTCGQPRGADAGCALEPAGCADGLWCDATAGRCTATRPTGGPCASDAACGAGRCVEGTCRVLRQLDEACAPSEVCTAGASCVDGWCRADACEAG